LNRITRSQEQISAKTKVIVELGNKRILLAAGEAYPGQTG
jgi:hypothetical protein